MTLISQSIMTIQSLAKQQLELSEVCHHDPGAILVSGNCLTARPR